MGLAGISAPHVAPSWAKSGPTGGDRSWPSDLIRRSAASLARSKPGRRPPPTETLEHFHPLSLYHETAVAAMVTAEGMTRRRRRGLLAVGYHN